MSLSPLVSQWLDTPSHLFGLAGTSLVVGFLYNLYQRNRQYAAIPAIGRTGFITSFIDALRFQKQGKEMIDEGYRKYYPGAFRVPTLGGWFVIVTGDKLVEELRKAPDSSLSFTAALNDILAADYTFGPNVQSNRYHVDLIRGNLNKYLEDVYPDVVDEVSHAFNHLVPLEDEWKSYSVFPIVSDIVVRVSNRTFIGLPVCREPEFLKLNDDFTISVFESAGVINMFPGFLKPIVAKMVTKVSQSLEVGMKYVVPVVEERRKLRAENGPNYPDKPNDVLSWLMDEAKGEEQSARNLTMRILTLNFASIHTAAMALAHAILELAHRPEYIQPLREEIEQAVSAHGWTKAAIREMYKLDSFFREDQRLAGVGAATMNRKALHDYVFADGTRVPKGTMIFAASWARHHDDRLHKDAETFNGFRYSDLREEERIKNQMVATSNDFLQFGHGRRACPGRFYASMEIKTMMAHLLMYYDIKAGTPPKHFWFAHNLIVDHKADIMIRKRRV